MNKKGFTLIELLAVIVILAILLGIAIPKVSQYINKSRKEAFIDTGQIFIESVRKDATSEEFAFPIRRNDVTIVTLDRASIQKSKIEKSSFSGKYLFNKSYVAIINAGTGTDPEYVYYFAAQDSKDYAVALTEETLIKPSSVVANARNKMEVTIQSLCGTEEGLSKSFSTISGLDAVQPVDEDGNKIDWNAIIYSTSRCVNND